ncbi:MAG TPA: type II toxin-antitoxin system RelE/ParE family toxin, partial [Lachnospiraceae bacterium]|nr:type II toxin-antitoxin system RelE/ParE family toxin [Lachnospiraceae bacterium]
MVKYKVKVTPRAFRDLDEIYSYIALEKLAPENAQGQIHRIRETLSGLDTMPQSHQDRQTGRYANHGYKQLLSIRAFISAT